MATMLTRGILRGSLVNWSGGKMTPGLFAELQRTWSDQDVRDYSHVGGDANPLHLDAEFAATTRFGQRIAHGMLTAGLFGTTLATCVPGTVYVAQNLRFVAPVFLDDTVVARIQVASVKGRMVSFDTAAYKATTPEAAAALAAFGEGYCTQGAAEPDSLEERGLVPVITGDATVMVPRPSEDSV